MGEKTGPKSKYRANLGDILLEIAEKGGHQAQMFVALGEALGQRRPVSPDTFARWRKEYPEFEEAYQASRVVSQAFYENLLLRGSVGMIPGFNCTALAMTLNNKFPEEYKRNANGNSDSAHTTVNIVNLSPDEIKYKIAQKQEYLKQKGQLIELLPNVEEDSD